MKTLVTLVAAAIAGACGNGSPALAPDSGFVDAGGADGGNNQMAATLSGAGAFSVAFVGSNYYVTSAADGGVAVDPTELFVTLFASDVSAQWQQVCASVNVASVPARPYVQLELIDNQNAPVSPGTFSVHPGGSTLGIVMVGADGGPPQYASDGQVTLTSLTPEGSASGSFSVTVGASQLGGTFSNSAACTATPP